MTLIKRSNDLFPNFFDDFFGRDSFFNNNDFVSRNNIPAVNIKENKTGYVVELAAPGMDKENFKVELNDDTLTISYHNKGQKETNNDSYTKREFNYQSFSRSFKLPNTVAADKIGAKYKEGVLKLEIPKKEEAKQEPSRLISIS